ncbi:MAG: ABC transporter substrate-binding protein [Pseudobutyrivibrio ruminis]|nr:ABC transporter substrate-binding protein [Pseudobutyrivibrio ruminis]
MKKKIFALLLTAALGIGAVACGANNTAETASDNSNLSETTSETGELTTVRLAIMTGGSSHWYAVIGDKEGIFEKHGIKVEISEFAAGVNTVDAVAMGQADFGNLADYAAVNRIGNTKEETNLVIVDRLSTSAGTQGGSLYVADGITSVEDLANVPFATQTGTVWDYWVAKTYESAGIAESEQNIVSVDSMASAVALMTTGDVQAVWASGQNAAKLEEAGFNSILTLNDLNLYTDAYYISTSDYLNENPELVKAFIEAQEDIAEWIENNKEAAAADFEAASGVSQDQFLSDIEATKLVTDFTQETLDHLNGIKDWAVAGGRFEDYNILDYTDLTALKAVYPDSVTVE